jgi:hypothetical protein
VIIAASEPFLHLVMNEMDAACVHDGFSTSDVPDSGASTENALTIGDLNAAYARQTVVELGASVHAVLGTGSGASPVASPWAEVGHRRVELPRGVSHREEEERSSALTPTCALIGRRGARTITRWNGSSLAPWIDRLAS